MTLREALDLLGCTCEPEFEVDGFRLDPAHDPECFLVIVTDPSLDDLWESGPVAAS
jgi:hypothetical protein